MCRRRHSEKVTGPHYNARLPNDLVILNLVSLLLVQRK
jgi:hypothetical protein